MNIWAIADLHLSFATPEKGMELFGHQWDNWTERVKEHWTRDIKGEDLVLLAGDLSWSKDMDGAIPDLEWIDHLPGTKVIIRGNHDYWWQAIGKLRKVLPPSINAIQHDSFEWNGVSVGGARLWDTPEFNFEDYIHIKEKDMEKLTEHEHDTEAMEKIFHRELGRLEMSLESMNQDAEKKIVMTHYPPLSATLGDSRVSALLEKYGIDICVFGHLHNVKPDEKMFGEKSGIQYILTSCDYIECQPIKIL